MSEQSPSATSVQALQQRAAELLSQGQGEAALALLADAVAAHPGAIEMHLLEGDVLAGLRREREALTAYRRARALDARDVRTLSREGMVLLRLQQTDAALAVFGEALSVAPELPGSWYNRGLSFAAFNKIAEALADFDKAIAIAPDFAVAHINRAMMLLLTGRYGEGFAELEWRFNAEPGARELREYRAPRWRKGNAVAGKHVLLYAEQGMGDVIQFARFVPQVAASAARVSLDVQPALARLLKALPCEVIVRGAPIPPFNLHSPLASLPHLLDVKVDTVPARVPYLTAPAEDVARWRAKLAPLAGKLKVGLVWAGNPLHNNDYNRSIPFAEMAALLQLPDLAFVSLQKDMRDADLAALQATRIFDAARELGDFEDTAGLIECLDLVICADTSVAHLAGALGRPVWVLLPFAADWRWMLERSDSPWYPSATLFRQTSIGDWAGVVARVAAALTRRI